MTIDELVFASELPSATIARRLSHGGLRRLATGVYTTDTTSPPDAVVRRHALAIAGQLYPRAVVTDRSARSGGPVDGRLYLAHDRRPRVTELPGLTITTRRGAGPLAGDVALPGGLHVASTGRALAENVRPSRQRAGNQPRTMTLVELEAWIDRLCRVDGEAKLAGYREQAERVASVVGTTAADLAVLVRAIGVALGSRQAPVAARALAARQAGRPYDEERVDRFDRLVRALREAAPQSRPVDRNDPERYRVLPFFEAYFSNYIEGTEFALAEAEALVYDDVQPVNRPADAHDLVGTFAIVADDTEMSRRFDTVDEFVDAMRARHSIVMAGRPERRPGALKDLANQAGRSVFVAPDLVQGTLVEAFARLPDLDTPWERAVYTMFFVAEIHPFDDGNGRIARIMMNGELVANAETRIIIPTVFRSDYLGALRRLTRDDDPSVFVKAMRYAHDWTFGIEFESVESATTQLAVTNAFEEDDSGRRLLLPQRSRDVIASL